MTHPFNKFRDKLDYGKWEKACPPPLSPASLTKEQLDELVASIQDTLWSDMDIDDDDTDVSYWDASKPRDSIAMMDAIYEAMARAGLRPPENQSDPGTVDTVVTVDLDEIIGLDMEGWNSLLEELVFQQIGCQIQDISYEAVGHNADGIQVRVQATRYADN